MRGCGVGAAPEYRPCWILWTILAAIATPGDAQSSVDSHETTSADSVREVLARVEAAHAPPEGGVVSEFSVTARVVWRAAKAGSPPREVPVAPICGRLLAHPDGRTIVFGWAPGTPEPDRIKLGTAFDANVAVARLSDDSVAVTREAHTDWRLTGLGLLDQSGRFLDCEGARCSWWGWVANAYDVQQADGTWVLSAPSTRMLLATAPDDGATIMRASTDTVDRQGQQVSSTQITVLSTRIEDRQVVPTAVEYRGIIRVMHPEFGLDIGATTKKFQLTERRSLQPGEFDATWTAFHSLAPGQLLTDTRHALSISGGSRFFRVADQPYLAAAPFVSARLPPVEVILSSSKRVE